MRPLSSFFVALLGLVAAACTKPQTAPPPVEPTASPTAAAEVVANVEAQPGDTTTCPFSGKTFVVKAEHPRVEYQGQTYWICSEEAAEKVRADPGKYLDDFHG